MEKRIYTRCNNIPQMQSQTTKQAMGLKLFSFLAAPWAPSQKKVSTFTRSGTKQWIPKPRWNCRQLLLHIFHLMYGCFFRTPWILCSVDTGLLGTWMEACYSMTLVAEAKQGGCSRIRMKQMTLRDKSMRQGEKTQEGCWGRRLEEAAQAPKLVKASVLSEANAWVAWLLARRTAGMMTSFIWHYYLPTCETICKDHKSINLFFRFLHFFRSQFFLLVSVFGSLT